MAAISAKDIQRLRQQAGVGMMETKRALEDADGEFDAAMKLLRERGLAKSGERTDFVAMRSDVEFQGLFNRVWKLHPRVGKQLYAVVMKRIVRGGNDHSGFKIILPHEASYSRRGEDTCEGHGCAGLCKSGGQDGRDVRAGFASIHTD